MCKPNCRDRVGIAFPVLCFQHLLHQKTRVTIVDCDIWGGIRGTSPLWPGVVIKGDHCLEIKRLKAWLVRLLQHSQLGVLDAAA